MSQCIPIAFLNSGMAQLPADWPPDPFVYLVVNNHSSFPVTGARWRVYVDAEMVYESPSFTAGAMGQIVFQATIEDFTHTSVVFIGTCDGEDVGQTFGGGLKQYAVDVEGAWRRLILLALPFDLGYLLRAYQLGGYNAYSDWQWLSTGGLTPGPAIGGKLGDGAVGISGSNAFASPMVGDPEMGTFGVSMAFTVQFWCFVPSGSTNYLSIQHLTNNVGYVPFSLVGGSGYITANLYGHQATAQHPFDEWFMVTAIFRYTSVKISINNDAFVAEAFSAVSPVAGGTLVVGGGYQHSLCYIDELLFWIAPDTDDEDEETRDVWWRDGDGVPYSEWAGAGSSEPEDPCLATLPETLTFSCAVNKVSEPGAFAATYEGTLNRSVVNGLPCYTGGGSMDIDPAGTSPSISVSVTRFGWAWGCTADFSGGGVPDQSFQIFAGVAFGCDEPTATDEPAADSATVAVINISP